MISNRNAALWCSQFATLIGSGVPIDHALGALHKSAPTAGLRRMSANIRRRIEAGETLAQAVAAHRGRLPRLLPILIEVGEQSGRLDEALSTLAAYYDTQWDLTRTAWAHLLPTLVYFALCGVLIVFIRYIHSGWSSDWLEQTAMHIATVAGAIVFVILVIRLAAPIRAGIALIGSVLPVVSGIMRQSAIARFAMALRATLNAGIEIRRAIDLSAEAAANPVFGYRLRRARKHIDKGFTIAQALDRTRVLSADAMAMINTGEQSGRLVDSLGHVAVAARFRATTASRTGLRIFSILVYTALLLYIAYTVVTLWAPHIQGILDLADPSGASSHAY
ncbi:MAG: type II secretion system F family protein [Verrucomicrobia bacterium]|nr:type II secretion system F family protein [Verrucomicrobiota bacterium]